MRSFAPAQRKLPRLWGEKECDLRVHSARVFIARSHVALGVCPSVANPQRVWDRSWPRNRPIPRSSNLYSARKYSSGAWHAPQDDDSVSILHAVCVFDLEHGFSVIPREEVKLSLWSVGMASRSGPGIFPDASAHDDHRNGMVRYTSLGSALCVFDLPLWFKGLSFAVVDQ